MLFFTRYSIPRVSLVLILYAVNNIYVHVFIPVVPLIHMLLSALLDIFMIKTCDFNFADEEAELKELLDNMIHKMGQKERHHHRDP